MTAIIGTLRAAAGLTALVGARIYNNVPMGTVFPYVEVTAPTANRLDALGRLGQQTLVDVKAVSQWRGDEEGIRIRAQVKLALDGQTPAASGHTILGIAWELNERLEEMIGGDRTRTLLSTYRVWSEQSST